MRDAARRSSTAIERLPLPSIAAINGFAYGGGLELAMACTLRVASENAKMGLPETSLGIIPGYGGTQRLARLVGRAKALELVLTAEKGITAAEAHRLGLVNQVVPAGQAHAAASRWRGKIAANGPAAVPLCHGGDPHGPRHDPGRGASSSRRRSSASALRPRT